MNAIKALVLANVKKAKLFIDKLCGEDGGTDGVWLGACGRKVWQL